MLDDWRVKGCDGNFSDEELLRALESGERQYFGMNFMVVSVRINDRHVIGYETIPPEENYWSNNGSNHNGQEGFRVLALKVLEVEE
ncbi:MAG: hypothetical protein KKG75_01350 [Nanoarchaeota archaeon]|nr:hypothetical protein [Nanoarchaeota archaeon]